MKAVTPLPTCMRALVLCVCERPPHDPLLPPFCMTFCLSSELSVMQVMHGMLSFFATGVDIKVIECVPYPLADRRHHDNTQTNKPSQA